jgi:heme exporter protein C
VITAFIHKFSSPKSFVRLTQTLYPFFIVLGVCMLTLGWVWGLLFAPQDAVQGNSYRIIFLHVPSVIFAELIYFFMAICALMHLVWRVKLAAYLIKAAAPIGAMITFLGLIVWFNLGNSNMGNMVAVGCTNHLNTNIIYYVFRNFNFAWIIFKQRKS